MLSFFKFLFIRSEKSRFCSVTPIEIEPSPTSDSEYNLSGIIDANKIYVKITNEMTTYSKFNKKIIGKQLYDIQNDTTKTAKVPVRFIVVPARWFPCCGA